MFGTFYIDENFKQKKKKRKKIELIYTDRQPKNPRAAAALIWQWWINLESTKFPNYIYMFTVNWNSRYVIKNIEIAICGNPL